MKTLLFALCFLGATAAFGQAVGGVLSAEPMILQLPNHPSQAVQHSMADERNLLGTTNNSSAQGELPLWEVMPLSRTVPLGDVARAYRKEHAAIKKADKVWSKQGRSEDSGEYIAVK